MLLAPNDSATVWYHSPGAMLRRKTRVSERSEPTRRHFGRWDFGIVIDQDQESNRVVVVVVAVAVGRSRSNICSK